MEMKRHPQFNLFLTPAVQRTPSESAVGVGSRPSWDFNSPDNHESWRDVFVEMAAGSPSTPDNAPESPTSETYAPELVHTPAQPSTPIREAMPLPIDAWLARCNDEVVVRLDNDTSLLIAVRRLADSQTFRSLTVTQPVWDVWRGAKDAMKRLGFRALKERGQWILEWSAVRKKD